MRKGVKKGREEEKFAYANRVMKHLCEECSNEMLMRRKILFVGKKGESQNFGIFFDFCRKFLETFWLLQNFFGDFLAFVKKFLETFWLLLKFFWTFWLLQKIFGDFWLLQNFFWRLFGFSRNFLETFRFLQNFFGDFSNFYFF